MRFSFKKTLATILSIAMILSAFVGVLTTSAADATVVGALTMEDVSVVLDDNNQFSAVANINLTAPASYVEVAFTLGTLPTGVSLKSVSSDKGSVRIDDATGAIHASVEEEISALAITMTFDASAAVEFTLSVDKIAFASFNEADETINIDDTANVVVAEPEVGCKHVNVTKVFATATETEFIYNATCADCGEALEDVRVAIGTPLASQITLSKTIEPRNDVSILIEVPANKLTAYSELILVANKEEYATGAAEATITPYYITEYAASTIYNGYTEFKFSKINAYEMQNNVHFVLYGKSGDKMIQLGTLDYSVADYVANQVVKKLSSSVTAELKTALVDMLIYGSKVQIYAENNAQNLAIDELAGLVETGTNKDVMTYATPESEWASSAADVNALPSTVTVTNNLDNTTAAGKLGLSRTLELSNKVNTLFVITGKGTADINDLYIKYEYYNVQGKPATPIVAAYEGVMYQSRYPAFKFDQAPVSVYDYPIKATVYYGHPDNGGKAIADTVYNPASYIAKNLGSSINNLAPALKALDAYAKSLAVLAGVTAYAN